MARTWLIAHRGLSLREPENTMAAFAASLDEVDQLELDVRATSDCELVCLHDRSLARTHGIDRHVGQVTWAELRDLAPDVPRLDEVLDAFGPQAGWYLHVQVRRPRAMEALARVVEAAGISWEGSASAMRAGEPLPRGTAAMLSEHADLLAEFRSRTGAGCGEVVESSSSAAELVVTAPFLAAYAQAVVLPDVLATPRMLRLLRALRLASMVYTVNDQQRIDELAALRATAVFTDDVAALSLPGDGERGAAEPA